jgi:hypothetical protein
MRASPAVALAKAGIARRSPDNRDEGGLRFFYASYQPFMSLSAILIIPHEISILLYFLSIAFAGSERNKINLSRYSLP